MKTALLMVIAVWPAMAQVDPAIAAVIEHTKASTIMRIR